MTDVNESDGIRVRHGGSDALAGEEIPELGLARFVCQASGDSEDPSGNGLFRDRGQEAD